MSSTSSQAVSSAQVSRDIAGLVMVEENYSSPSSYVARRQLPGGGALTVDIGAYPTDDKRPLRMRIGIDHLPTEWDIGYSFSELPGDGELDGKCNLFALHHPLDDPNYQRPCQFDTQALPPLTAARVQALYDSTKVRVLSALRSPTPVSGPY